MNIAVSHPELGEGIVLDNLGNGQLLIKFSDGEYVKQATDIKISDAPSPIRIRQARGWTPKRAQFYFEQYTWLKETGPQHQPFGLNGKMRQAEYREKNGLSFVDPVLSNLALWGGILADRGYVRRTTDGLWEVTEKAWEEN